MNLMEEMDTEKSNEILMLNTDWLFQHGGVRKDMSLEENLER